jgi:hypothetical protein
LNVIRDEFKLDASSTFPSKIRQVPSGAFVDTQVDPPVSVTVDSRQAESKSTTIVTFPLLGLVAEIAFTGNPR